MNHHKVDNWQEKVLNYTVPKVYTLEKDVEKSICNQVDKILKGSHTQFFKAISDSDENTSEHVQSRDKKTNSLSSHSSTARQSKCLQNAKSKSKSQYTSVSNSTAANASAEGHNHSSQSVSIVSTKKSSFVQRNGFASSNWVAEHDVFIVKKSERPQKSSTFVINPPFSHFSYWERFKQDLELCEKDIDRMKQCEEAYLQLVPENGYKITTLFNVRLDWDSLDTLAHSLWPRDAPYNRENSFQINTEAVGNCLLSSASRIISGTQNNLRELRTHITVEGLYYKNWYMQNDNLAIGLPALETNYTLPE